jgi:hypothetical protein
MKRILRIIIGLPLSTALMFLATWVWLWETTEESWMESVGLYTWYLASGDWDKLPD